MVAIVMKADAISRRQLHGRRFFGGLALLFGLITLMEGGRTLFGGPEVQAAAGPIVSFVLIFNFLAGFLYVLTGIAALQGRMIALRLAWFLALSTLAVFAALAIHIIRGEPYATRTPMAMLVRSVFWLLQALLLPRYLK